MRYRFPIGVVCLSLAAIFLSGCPEEENSVRRYSIEVSNISSQPMSPIVAVTHHGDHAIWEAGQLASPGVSALAEAGEISTLLREFESRIGITDWSYSTLPITPEGIMAPRFGETAGTGPDLTDTQTLEIEAQPGDLISLVGGLLGTNDGFWGVDRAVLPEAEGRVFFAFAYDAGTEVNNELEAFINDDASFLAPEPVSGDEPEEDLEPDNRTEATAPPTGIRRHDGIAGTGDVPLSYDFDGVVVRVTISRVPLPG